MTISKKFSLTIGLLFSLTTSLYAGENILTKPDLLPRVIVTPIKINYCGYSEHRLDLENFPINQDFFVEASSPILDVDRRPYTLRFNELGHLWQNGNPIAGIVFFSENDLRGDRVTYRFILPNEEEIARVSLIPKPLLFHSKKGTFSLELELYKIDPTSYGFRFFGLVENEKIKIINTSLKKPAETNHVYKEKDELVLEVNLDGGKSGIANLTIIRANGDELKAKISVKGEIMEVWKKDVADAKEKLQSLILNK